MITYVLVVAIPSFGIHWQDALGAVLWAGLRLEVLLAVHPIDA